MGIPRVIAHPVMGWYTIALLGIIVAVPPIFFFISPDVAGLFALFGTIIVVASFGLYAWIDSRRHDQ
jgi:hypothetical protein